MSKPNEACKSISTPESSSTPTFNTLQLSIDLPCEDSKSVNKHETNLTARSHMTKRDNDLSARSKMSEHTEGLNKISTIDQHSSRFTSTGKHCNMGAGDVASQTRRDATINSENSNSSKMYPPIEDKNLLEACDDRAAPIPTPRNPITGLGLGEDGVGGIKPKKPKDRRGLQGGKVFFSFK